MGRFADDEARAETTNAGSELAKSLEWYLGGLLQLIDFTRSRGVWCDSVIELSIRRLHRRAFLIAGVSYSPHDLIPFEVEFHFARRRDVHPTHTIVRFGERAPDGDIRRTTKRPDAVVSNRPIQDRDWAVTVEIRPAET